MVEHPAELDDEQDFPSIWRLPVVQMLMRFEGCQCLRIQQGHYGAPSCKPTDLWIAHAEAAEQTLCSGRTTRVPLTTSIGKDESGCWKTGKLKEYPGALCRTLAALFDVSQPHVDQGENLPEWFADAVTKLIGHFDQTAERGPDFCIDARAAAKMPIRNSCMTEPQATRSRRN